MKKKVDFDLSKNRIFIYKQLDDRIIVPRLNTLRQAIIEHKYNYIKDLIILIKRFNINLNVHDNEHNGLTILHLAIINNVSEEIITLLIEAGADVNFADGHQITPLLRAFLTQNIDITLLLLRHGADISNLHDRIILSLNPNMQIALENAGYLPSLVVEPDIRENHLPVESTALYINTNFSLGNQNSSSTIITNEDIDVNRENIEHLIAIGEHNKDCCCILM